VETIGVICEDPVETNLTRMTDRFQQAMRLMRKHDPQTKEDGFGLLRLHAAEHIDHSDDESLRWWAVRGLEQLGTKPARCELWQARANGLID
jgi:hypothetical protein